MGELPQEVAALIAERERARAAKDFSAADALRDRIGVLGYRIVDTPEGPRAERIEAGVVRLDAAEVPSVLDEPPRAEFSVQWLVQGWPEDVVRGIASFRAVEGGRAVQHVVVDATGAGDPGAWPEGTEVVSLTRDFGWGADRNAGLRRAAGRIVLVADGSIAATGDVFGPLAEALDDPAVGIAGPFGIATDDLRTFHDSDGVGRDRDVDAIEGYLMGFRREVLGRAGPFDEKFKFYRTADIEYSFRVKDQGLRARVVPVPVTRHEHRMWNNTPEAERERLSKRNFYLFLDRFRGRLDLCVSAGEGSS